MSCSYYLKDSQGIEHRFESELALDDFLLLREPLQSELGDLVFSKTEQATSVGLLKAALLRARNVSEKSVSSTDGEKYLEYANPYIGVNRWVNQLRDGDKRIVPEFIDENYWEGVLQEDGKTRIGGRINDWKGDQLSGKGKFTETEVEILKSQFNYSGFTEVKGPNGKITHYEGAALTNEADRDALKKAVQRKWEMQCLAGDAIHKVLELYVYRDLKDEHGVGTGKLFKDVLWGSDKDAKLRFLKKLKSTTFKGIQDKNKTYKFEEIMSDSAIENTLIAARDLITKIESKWGKDLYFFPELKISGELKTPASNGATQLLGIIDLVVVDSKGRVHLFDYKTSLKSYEEFDTAKLLAYKYQIATYQMLLRLAGIEVDENETNNSLAIVPLKIDGFHYENGKWTFSGTKVEQHLDLYGNTVKTVLEEQGLNILNVGEGKIYEILERNIVAPQKMEVTSDDILSNTFKFMNEVFHEYHGYKNHSDEEIRNMCKKCGAFEKQKDGENAGMLVFKPDSYGMDPIVVDPNKCLGSAEAVMLEKVKDLVNHSVEYRKKVTKNIISALKVGLSRGVEAFKSAVLNLRANNDPGASPDWLLMHLEKYCNNLWIILEDRPQWEALKELGIIVLYNPESHLYNAVKISASDLGKFVKLTNDTSGKSTNLTGRPDIYYDSRSDNLMMEAIQGNIEIMETMAAINCLDGAFNNSALIGEIEVINPIFGQGKKAGHNEELIWTFNELVNLHKGCVASNKFKERTIKMATQVQIANLMFHQIMTLGLASGFEGQYSDFKVADESGVKSAGRFTSCMTKLDECIRDSDPTRKLQALKTLSDTLKDTDFLHRLSNISQDTTMEQTRNLHTQLYFQVQLAIAELNGISYRQQNRSHKDWLQDAMVLKHGLQGLQYDNPGNTASLLLNSMTKLITQAYQRIRDDMQQPALEMRKKVEQLKKDAGYNKFKEYTTGNETDMYQKFFDPTAKDFRFKNINDPSLNNQDKEFLRYVLMTINRNRFLGKTDDELQVLMDSGNSDFYRVPLMLASAASVASTKGLMAMVKDYLNSWNPKEVAKRAKDAAVGYFSEELQLARRRNINDFYEMSNRFDGGEDPITRLKMLAGKVESDGLVQMVDGANIFKFEHNLEKLVLAHQYAYITKKHIDNIMPMLLASMIHLHLQGAEANTTFREDMKWLHDYIQNRVKNESLVDENQLPLEEYLKKVREAASTAALALSPVQGAYQSLQGIWNDIGLIIRKPDGTNAFTFKNFIKAAKIIYADALRESTTPTFGALTNLLYGLNDMDMNTYVDGISQNKHGLWNFKNFLFKFSSRPDYYNRMLIFTCKMIEDGCYDAHKVSNGELKYDWTQDKRFSKYAKNPTSDDPEVVAQRALYIALAQEFMKEGATIKVDGKEVPFTLNVDKPMPLPRAYTNREAESIKSLCDSVYGYYSHEKKSMFLSTLIGSLFFQMKTYWSGKKNQYLGAGGVKLEGHWDYYTEEVIAANGEKHNEIYYYQVDALGNILFNEPPVKGSEAKSKIAPVMVWKGDWKEGCLVTLNNLCGEIVKNDWDIKAGWNAIVLNPNMTLRNAYRSNLKQMAYDLTMFGVVGSVASAYMWDWYGDLKKDSDKEDIGDGLKLAAANMACLTVRNSFLDFNWIDSIGSPATSWSPFAFDYLTRQILNVWNTALGDLSLFEGVLRTTSVGRQFKPFLDAVSETITNH